MNDNQSKINIKMDDEMAKGVHGQDVIISITDKDVCLTFFVKDPTGQQGFVTSRVFLPYTTAIQLSELIRKLLGPTYEKYVEIMKNPPPSVSEQTSSEVKPKE